MRFTIRDLTWLTAVVALTCGWFVDRSLLSRSKSELEVRLRVVTTAMDEFMQQRDELVETLSRNGWSTRKDNYGMQVISPPKIQVPAGDRP
jgi:hypothetical protein